MADQFEIERNKVIYNGITYDFDKLPENVVFDGGIDISWKCLKMLPNITTWVINGSFVCSNNRITSLFGCPYIVDGGFWCDDNNLKSLEYCPKMVGGVFCCYSNKLRSLEHCPRNIKSNFYCWSNNLETLEHCPEYVETDFNCSDNNLTSLEGCPKKIGRYFNFSHNPIEIIDSFPEYIGEEYCASEKIKSIKEGVVPLKYLIEFYKKGLYNSKELLMKEFDCNTEEELNAYLIIMGKI